MQFNLSEVLLLLGMVQSLYVIVHLISSAKLKSQIFIPVVFFTNIFIALLTSFAFLKWGNSVINLEFGEWLCWSLLPMTATLFSVQLITINKLPSVGFWMFPIIYACVLTGLNYTVLSFIEFQYTFQILAIFGGSLSILLIWILEGDIAKIKKSKNGNERFWVIVSLLLVSTGFMSLILLSLFDVISIEQYKYINIIMALAFTYLGSTGLFRIYPYPVELKTPKDIVTLSEDELKTAKHVEELLKVQKVYQEQGYNRGNLAREVEMSEAQLTKVVKSHFNKTVPLLLNELRVEDAKSLLIDTEADVTTIAYESGFNSLATFNRVFKAIVGQSPTKYREQ